MQTASLPVYDRVPVMPVGVELIMRPVPVADAFSNETLQDALGLLADVTPTWLHSCDGEAKMVRLTQDLDLYVGILEETEDASIRARATTTLREISKIFYRDQGYGLVAEGMDADLVMVLLSPDAYETAN